MHALHLPSRAQRPPPPAAMHLISLLAGLLLSCTAAFAASVAARANETTGGYVGPGASPPYSRRLRSAAVVQALTDLLPRQCFLLYQSRSTPETLRTVAPFLS